MHFITVRLDRIFDVVYQVYRGQENTFFSFQYGSKRVFGICMQGRHFLETGAVLTVCLRKENDWTSLVGWYNHSTDATVVESAAPEVMSMFVIAVIVSVILWNVHLDSVARVVLLLVAGTLSIGYLHLVLFARQVRAGLARVKLSPAPELALPPGEGKNNEADAQH